MSGWSIVATIVSALAAIVGGLVILNLRSLGACITRIKRRQDMQDGELKDLAKQMSTCKQDCDRNTVSKEDWVRSEGYTRRGIDKLSQQLAGMDGKLGVVEKLPEICGNIVREVVREIKKEPNREQD